jgi:hypothetical protein
VDSINIVIKKNSIRSDPRTISCSRVAVFGSECNLRRLSIVFETNAGQIERFKIKTLSFGFAHETTENFRKVWFEFDNAVEDCTIHLVLE